MIILNRHKYRLTTLLTVLLLSLTACTPAADTASADNDDNIDNEAKVRVDERMATDITPSGSFTRDSFDDIKIGGTFDPKVLTQNTENLNGCFGAESANHPNADYMIIDNTVVEIVTSDSTIASAYGVTVGNSLEELYAKHGDQSPEVEDSPYGNPNENIIVYYWYGHAGQDQGVKYQVDNNIVTSISIGLESALRLRESCV